MNTPTMLLIRLNHTLEPNKPKGKWHMSFAAQGIPNADGTGTPQT